MEERQENWDSENSSTSPSPSKSNKYAELLQEENTNLKNFIHNILNINSSSPTAEEQVEKMKDELILMYELSIADLHNELKTLSTFLSHVEENHEKEKEAMKKAHALNIQDCRRQEQMKFAKMVKENQRLINDLVNCHREEIHQWRMEFERDVKMTVEEACIREAENQDQGQDSCQLLKNYMWEKFQGSNQLVIIIFAGVIALCIVFKSYLPICFITWAMPKLIMFAQNFIQNYGDDESDAGRWISEFMESETGTRVMNLLVERGSLDDFYDLAKKVYEEKSNDIISGVMKYITSNLLTFTNTKVKTG